MMIDEDSERTRLIGHPVPTPRNWHRIAAYAGYCCLIAAMVAFGVYYMVETDNEDASLNLTMPTAEVLATTDIPGADGIYEPDDTPGEVTLSDAEFADLVNRSAQPTR